MFHVRGFLRVSYLSMFFVIFLQTSQWTHKLRGKLVLSTVLFITNLFLSCIGSIFFFRGLLARHGFIVNFPYRNSGGSQSLLQILSLGEK